MATVLSKFDAAIIKATKSGKRHELEAYRLMTFSRLVDIDDRIKLFCRKCCTVLTIENSKNTPRQGYCEICGKEQLKEIAQSEQERVI